MITSSNITAKTTLHINGEDYSSTKEYSRAKDINLEELIDYAESLANNLNCTATVSVVKKLD